MTLQKEPPMCPACEERSEFRFIRDHRKQGQTFSLYRCANCSVEVWMPLQLAGVQQSEIYTIRTAAEVINDREYYRVFSKRNKFSLGGGVAVLDLGCGTGEFLADLKKKGCEVWGVDFDKEAIKIATNHFGLKNVFAESFDDFFKRSNLPAFDHIVFFEAIQYVNNPAEFLRNVEALLKPEGKITISVPSRERILVNNSAWDFPPGPFTRWNQLAIINLFKRFGLSLSYIHQIEEFKILSGAIAGKLQTGLINKTLTHQENGKASPYFLKMLYLLGSAKQYVVSIIPAGVLWILGKVTTRRNGIIFAEFKKSPFV